MKKSVILLILNIFCTILYSQEEVSLPKIIPPSPELASLGKYGDIPVGHYTGVPDISIPLVELQGRGISIPISLSYHASGIKVNEIASRIGLGWSLNAGGVVSRSVRGIPDDASGAGYLYTEDNPSKVLNNTGNNGVLTNIFLNTSQGLNDLESDIYYYNFMGYSGKFFFNENGDIITNKQEDISITPIKIGDIIKGWKIITKEGTVYYLGLSKDRTKEATDTSTPAITTSLPGSGYTIPDPGIYMRNHITSWQLMEIYTPNGEVVTFEYDNNSIEYWNLINQKKYFWPSTPSSCVSHIPTTFSMNKEKTNRLIKIKINRGYVLLEYNKNREDLKGDAALTDVKMFDNKGSLVEHYYLNHDYFVSTNHLSNSTFGDLDQRRKRLYLKSIVQGKQLEKNKEYKLTYNTTHILPDRFSMSQDFWGYYNGKTNTFFYPTVKYAIDGRYIELNGGDRRVNETYTKACMLTKIEYPTRGTTEFEFESNKVSNQGAQFFGTTLMEKETIYAYNTVSTNQNEVILTVPVSNKSDFIGGLSWRVNFSQSCSNPTAFDCPQAFLYYGDNTTNPIYSTRGESKEYHLDIPENINTLTIKVHNYSGEFGSIRNDISLAIYGYKLPLNSENAAFSGGVRIRKIIHKDSDGSMLYQKRYKYTKFDDPSTSSGAALFPPTFIFKGKPVCIEGVNTLVSASELSSNSLFPLTNGGSYSTGYTDVTEYTDLNGDQGKTEYKFTFTYDGEGNLGNIYNGERYPLTPFHDLSYRRGSLLNKTIYKKRSGGMIQSKKYPRSMWIWNIITFPVKIL